jgi:hypothetical protein
MDNIIWGNLYDHLMSTKIFNLMMNKIHVSSEYHEKREVMGMIYLALMAYFMSYKKVNAERKVSKYVGETRRVVSGSCSKWQAS